MSLHGRKFASARLFPDRGFGVQDLEDALPGGVGSRADHNYPAGHAHRHLEDVQVKQESRQLAQVKISRNYLTAAEPDGRCDRGHP